MTVADLMGMDLGLCGAFLADGSRCQGRLVVDAVREPLVEATCGLCGSCAGCPVTRLEAPESEREESWWAK